MIIAWDCPDTANWPAIVQALGSLVGIGIAIAVPMWQRSRALSDAKSEEANRQRNKRRRITSALITEIQEAIEASARQEETQRKSLELISRARAGGIPIKDVGPFNPRAAEVTDAVIYGQAASAIGDFPELITESVIKFYAMASEMVRIAEVGGDFENAISVLSSIASRLRMSGEMAISSMKKWRQADFADDAAVKLTPGEIKILAQKVGYPIEDVFKER